MFGGWGLSRILAPFLDLKALCRAPLFCDSDLTGTDLTSPIEQAVALPRPPATRFQCWIQHGPAVLVLNRIGLYVLKGQSKSWLLKKLVTVYLYHFFFISASLCITTVVNCCLPWREHIHQVIRISIRGVKFALVYGKSNFFKCVLEITCISPMFRDLSFRFMQLWIVSWALARSAGNWL